MKLKALISLLILALQFIGIGNALGQSNDEEHSWLRRKLFQESFIEYRAERHSDSALYLSINPIVAFGTVNEAGENKTFNTRGFQLNASVGNKIRVSTRLEESQAELPFYANTFYTANNTIPKYARLKAFKTNGVDYTFATGQISYHAAKNLSFFVGNSRYHINTSANSRALQVGNHIYPLNYAGFVYANREVLKSNLDIYRSVPGRFIVKANYITGVSANRDTLFTTSEGLLRKTNGFYAQGNYRLIGISEDYPATWAKEKNLSFFEKSNITLKLSSLGLGLKPTKDIPAPYFPVRTTFGLDFNNIELGVLGFSLGKESKQEGLTTLVNYRTNTIRLLKRLTVEGELYYASSTQKQSNLTQAGLYLGLPYVNNAELGIHTQVALLQKGRRYTNRAELNIKANHFLKESTILGTQQTLDLSLRYIINTSADYSVQLGYVNQKLYTLTQAKPYMYFGFFANINHNPINF